MPSPSSISLGDIAFMMGSFQGVDTHELLQLGEGINKKFVFSTLGRNLAWRSKLPIHLDIAAPVFGIPFGVQQKRAGRWILGSSNDLNEIDFKIARNNRHGVSKKCLSIDFVTYADGTPILRITNESDNPLYIQHDESVTSTIQLAKGDNDDIRSPVIVRHAKFSFRIWLPGRTYREKQLFILHTRTMDRLAIDKSLEYWPRLDSGLATVDEASRVTLDGTVYTKVPNQIVAHGAFSTVFIVKRVGRDSITLCAKELVLQDDLDSSSSVAKRQDEAIDKEFESYKRFSHPHLAAAIDIAYMQDGSAPPWLVLEHIPFCLADYITRCDDPWPEGPLAKLDHADIIRQLFSFTAFLHRQGAVHKDLSPNNIRLYPDTKRWVVKVIDLGLLESVHHVKRFAGTTGFAAPEVLTGQPQDEKVDIFSLGMIAFYLLTGRYHKPHTQVSPEYQVQYMCKRVLPYVDKVEDKFRTLLRGLLTYDAKDRWSAQQVINYFWRLGLESDPDYDRKRIASPMALPENKKRRMSEDASTIRPPPAASEYPPSSTSFETAQEPQDQAQEPQGDLTSVPATPFSEVDLETEPVNDRPLADGSDRSDACHGGSGLTSVLLEQLLTEQTTGRGCTDGSDDGSDDKDWVFTTNLSGWPDRLGYTPCPLPHRDQELTPASDSGAETDYAQLGPSWVTGNKAETDGLAVDRPRTGCTADLEELQLGGTDGADSEAETDILPSCSLQSGLVSEGMEEPHDRLDAHDVHLPWLYQPGAEGQSKGLTGRASSPTLSEEGALEGVVSFSSSGTNLEEQPASSILSLSSSCHEIRSWITKERQGAQDIEDGERLAGSFGAKSTWGIEVSRQRQLAQDIKEGKRPAGSFGAEPTVEMEEVLGELEVLRQRQGGAN